MIGTGGDRMCRGCDALLIAQIRTAGAHTGGDDQTALGLRQGADQRGLLRRGDDAIGTSLERMRGTGGNDVRDIAGNDEVGIQIGAVVGGENRHRENL